MKLRGASLFWLGTTALCSVAVLWQGIALAQTATPQQSNNQKKIDIGSVTAKGTNAGSGGYVAPSGSGTQAQAIAKQRTAPNVIFVQPESVMRQEPAANVAESLQHLPGVSMQSDSGFGRFVVIKGLPEDLSATQYSGIDLPAVNTNASPTGGNRAVSFDFLAPGVIGGAQVISSLTPDMPATGLGGVVDLLPPSLPANGKPVLDVTAAAGFSNLQGNPLGQVSVTAGDHFAVPFLGPMENPKPFSFIGTFGYINISPGIFDVEESYTSPTVAGTPALLNNLQVRRYENNRVTRGYTAELDFDPNPKFHLFLRGLYSTNVETIQKNELYLQNLDGSSGGSSTFNGGGSFTATGANLNKFYENSSETTGLAFLEGGGRFVMGNLVTLNLHSAWTEGFDRFTKNYVTNFGSNDQNLTINYDTSNPAARTYSIMTAGGLPYDPANPANFTFSDLSNYPSTSIDQIYDNGASASVPTRFFDTIGTMKVGADIRLQHRTLNQYTSTATPINGPFSLASVTGGMGNQTDYSGMYNIGPNLNYGQFFSVPYSWTPSTTSNLLAYQRDQENVYAGFWQENLQYGRLGVLVGFRVEATDASYSGYGSTTDASGNTVANAALTTRNQSYVNVFPSVQLSYALTRKLQARFAYSTGIARPGWDQINPAVSFTAAGGQGGRDLVVTGNSALQPQTGTSYNLALAYYPSKDDILEADLFLTNMQNYIVPFTTNTPTTTFQTFDNVSGAQARGLILDAIEHFRYLPGPFSGLGIDANATFVDATGNVIQGQGRSQLPETYPLTFNVAELYDRGPFEFRLSESYTSRNIFSVASGPSTNVYTQPMFRMNVDLAYNVTPKWQVFFQGRNLTNTKLEFTQSGSPQFPIQREYYGQSFLLGIHYHMF